MRVKNLLISIQKIKYLFLNLCSEVSSDKNFKANCRGYEYANNHFITYRKKPKDTKNYYVESSKSTLINNIGIIMQGPILTSDSFTIQTIQYYKRMYPELNIVVSTWNTENEEILQQIRNEGAIIVLSEDPSIPGIGNINRQVITTNAGIEKCEEIKVEYLIKTRTDQRICKIQFLEYLISLYNVFSNSKFNKNNRVILMQATVGGSMMIPYMLSDMFVFGEIADVKKYFDIPPSTINHKEINSRKKYGKSLIQKNVSIQQYYSLMAPELMLALHYAMGIKGEKFQNNLRDYWEFVKNYVICISADEIELYWPKYNCYEESVNFHIYETNDSNKKLLRYNWGFTTWISLYSGALVYDKEYEKYKELCCKAFFES